MHSPSGVSSTPLSASTAASSNGSLRQQQDEALSLTPFSDTVASYPRAARIHDLFAEQVARTPDAVALEFGSDRLTYRALDEQSNRMARLLQLHGVGPDVRVGIFMERSIAFVVAVLATLKAGGAYVPLDPSYPSERLSMMLEEAQAPVLLTQASLVDRAPSLDGVTAICVDRDKKMIAQISTEPVSSDATADNLAYVLFTSGSTGRPKGVAMPHRPLVNLVHWQRERSILGVGDRTLQFSALSFDVSFQELFSTWCSGGCLVLVSEETRRDATALLRLLEGSAVQRLFLPFVALQHIAEMAQAHELYPSALREVITAGEQLKIVPSLETFFRRLPHCSLENQYGPTESHVVTAYRLPDAVDEWSTLPPIGRPIANVAVYLLDEDQQPVPIGETGELYIGGDCLAREYLNQPEQTGERFLPDPFRASSNARMYRTGDLARYRPDGNIEFLGRADFQVKVRGYRIELGEVEAALNNHDSVREAVVTTDQSGAQGNQNLVAYVVPQPGATVEPSVLRAHLNTLLPAYMVPALYEPMEAFPLTPSGKVDRKALPAPTTLHRRMSDDDVVPPRDDLEAMLVTLWEDALDVRPVGIRDSFFDLGGHSLLAAELLVTLGRELGRDLPLALLADTPTIEALADKLREGKDSAAWSPLVPIRPTGSKTPLFCVHGGGRNVLRFHGLAQMLDPDQPVYGLQWAGLNGQPVEPSVEAVASIYLAEIRSVQPAGPYLLAGHCFGGMVTYEIAQRLREAGESVELLVLFDTPNPSTEAFRSDTLTDRLAKWTPAWGKLHLTLRARLALGTRLASLRSRITGRPLSTKQQHAIEALRDRSALRRAWSTGRTWVRHYLNRPIPSGDRSLYGAQAMAKALRAYRPRPYAGRTVLFHTGQSTIWGFHRGRFTDERLGWTSMPPGHFDYHRIRTGHNEIVDHADTAPLLQTHLTAAHDRIRAARR